MKRTLLIGLGVIGLALSGMAATVIGVLPSASAPVINSTVGGTSQTLATNGLYPSSIIGAGAGDIVTNLVLLNPSGTGNTIVLQFSATAGGTVSANTATNVVYSIVSSLAPVTITTNAAGNGAYISALTTPTQPYLAATNWLSATAGTMVTTNLVLTPTTTPPFAGGLRLYLQTIQADTTSAAFVTNYAVYCSQQ